MADIFSWMSAYKPLRKLKARKRLLRAICAWIRKLYIYGGEGTVAPFAKSKLWWRFPKRFLCRWGFICTKQYLVLFFVVGLTPVVGGECFLSFNGRQNADFLFIERREVFRVVEARKIGNFFNTIIPCF